jgi:hypothetical protein
MKINEILSESSQTNEAAPMGFLQRMGQKILSKVPGQVGAQAQGKLSTGTHANRLFKQYQTWLGAAGETSTPAALKSWMTTNRLPVKAVEPIFAHLGPDAPLTGIMLNQVFTALVQAMSKSVGKINKG